MPDTSPSTGTWQEFFPNLGEQRTDACSRFRQLLEDELTRILRSPPDDAL